MTLSREHKKILPYALSGGLSRRKWLIFFRGRSIVEIGPYMPGLLFFPERGDNE